MAARKSKRKRSTTKTKTSSSSKKKQKDTSDAPEEVKNNLSAMYSLSETKLERIEKARMEKEAKRARKRRKLIKKSLTIERKDTDETFTTPIDDQIAYFDEDNELVLGKGEEEEPKKNSYEFGGTYVNFEKMVDFTPKKKKSTNKMDRIIKILDHSEAKRLIFSGALINKSFKF